MVYQLCCKVTIGELFFEYVHSVEINSTWKDLTSTAVIKLPRRVGNMLGKKLDEYIKRGDKVEIQLGYNDEFVTEFTGYVASVKPTWPVEVHCEDEMFLFKNASTLPKNFNSTSTTVKDVMDYLGVEQVMDYMQLGEMTIGKFAITKDEGSIAKVFSKLKQANPVLRVFIRHTSQGHKPVLVIGKPYDPTSAYVHWFAFTRNIIDHKLEYKRKDEIQYRVKAISKNTGKKDTSVTVGDVDGPLRTYTYLDKSDTELRELANTALEELKYDGYRGDFTAFGIPSMQHGDIASLVDLDTEDRDGRYWIDEMQKTFDENGYRQVAKLGPMA